MASVTLKGNFKKIMRLRDKELKRANQATAKTLERFGAIVRQDARRLIGSNAKPRRVRWEKVDGKRQMLVTPPSKPRPSPGPPRARTGHEFYSLRNIRYIADYYKRKVRIGYWYTGTTKYGRKTVPDLHEFGGTITTRVIFVRAELTRQNTRVRKGERVQVSSRMQMMESKKGRPVTFRIPKRPVMSVAYRKQKKQARAIWVKYYKARRKKS